MEKKIPVTMYFGDYIDNGDPAIQATGMWQAMRQACYDFEEAYNAQGGNCTVVDLRRKESPETIILCFRISITM
ncbi:MAG: hypothetical protein ACLUAR_00465 [Pilosibacter sp.]